MLFNGVKLSIFTWQSVGIYLLLSWHQMINPGTATQLKQYVEDIIPAFGVDFLLFISLIQSGDTQLLLPP